MKRIDELGISHTPWGMCQTKREISVTTSEEGFGDLESALCRGPRRKSNAFLIAYAPEMYECLRDAVIEMCHDCPNCGPYPDYQCKNKACECFLNEWRKVLAKAAGEEVDDGK